MMHCPQWMHAVSLSGLSKLGPMWVAKPRPDVPMQATP